MPCKAALRILIAEPISECMVSQIALYMANVVFQLRYPPQALLQANLCLEEECCLGHGQSDLQCRMQTDALMCQRRIRARFRVHTG